MSTLYTGNSNKSQIASNGGVSGGSIDNDETSRIIPRTVSTGALRGTQNVGYGNTKIDGSNNVISVGDSIILDGNNEIIKVGDSNTGTQGLGNVPNTTEAGFFQTDASGKVIYKLVAGTAYTYDSKHNYANSILNGFAPNDGRPGIWVAKTGLDATGLLSQ